MCVPLPLRLRHYLRLVCSAAFAAKTPPFHCGLWTEQAALKSVNHGGTAAFLHRGDEQPLKTRMLIHLFTPRSKRGVLVAEGPGLHSFTALGRPGETDGFFPQPPPPPPAAFVEALVARLQLQLGLSLFGIGAH